MLRLPAGYRGIAPDQRGYGEADADQKIDATRGAGDLADDAVALLNQASVEKVHLVGNSMGGSVVWRMLTVCPNRVRTVTLVAPGSPFGFGGTRDAEGTPCWEDFAGTGGAFVNPELVRRIQSGDRGLEHPFSPRAALRALVYKPPFVPPREEDLLTATLQTHVGAEGFPGDSLPSPNWPYRSAGKWGLTNATSSKYAGDVSRLYGISPKPPILWVRGSHDLAISDSAASCPGALGGAGMIGEWPGPEVFPPQPMLAQTRAVLEKYAALGGVFLEAVIDDTGHVPFIEKPEEFDAVFHVHLKSRARL